MVNRKCRMLFKSLCISMSVMLTATPASPGFQAAETQTEAQTQEAEAVDNGTSSEAETVASAEAKEESVPASSEDKASDGETGTEAPQSSGDAPSGGEAQGSDVQEAPKAKESPQSEAPSKPESEPAAQAPEKERNMKITTFNPLIVSKDAESIITLFEELGFEKRHTPTVDTGDRKVTRTRMKDANGLYVDISKVEMIPRDMTAIRMNVDNFREAHDLLTAHGFKKAPGIEEVDLETAKALLMVSPSGFAIEVIEHIKD